MAVLDLIRTVAPSDTPVSLAEAKEQVRVEVDDHDDDAFIQGLIDAATAHLDGYSGILGRCLLTQTWVLYLETFPACGRIDLPLKPLVSVTGVTYVDGDGATQTLATSVYQVLNGPVSALALKYNQTWPTVRRQPRSVAITFTAGAATQAAVPENIRAAIRLAIGSWYENREAGAFPQAALDLLATVRAGNMIA